MTIVPSHIKKEFHLTAEHPCFSGHFPGNPIFPAIAQLSLVVTAIEESCGVSVIVRGVSQAKFLKKILPNSRLDLTIEIEAGDRAQWTLTEGPEICSKGRLNLAFTTM